MTFDVVGRDKTRRDAVACIRYHPEQTLLEVVNVGATSCG